MNQFFVSTPLDFEKVTLQEMKEVWPLLLGKDARPHALPFPEVKLLSGGLEFETDLFAAVQLNFFLKTANRVLLRMASFKARDLPKFYQKFRSLPWLEYLPHAHVDWEVAAQTSRLNNEKRLQESAEKALLEIFANKTEAKSCGAIYLRMEADLCTISLDTSGEHLHKRGWCLLRGEAPLRETIAAYLLRSLLAGVSLTESSQVTLLDPMVGSGTFLSEARTLFAGQFQRAFAFQKWKKAPKLFLSPSFALNYGLPAISPFKKYVGLDLNPEMIEVAGKNFAEAEQQLAQVQRKSFQKNPLELTACDALSGEAPAVETPLWMIVNPPYGERLPEAAQGGLSGLARALCGRYKPQKIGILYPEKERISQAPEGYKATQVLKINNGGIRCLFTILTQL